ncbi:alpha-beta hydrolase superfamily lysophospholipase [Leucobacter luti]|uniref:Alpha-beta hydrolase superfamily lysophospholipase n=1 Tax=Leucobacter luti TaxID=340320 RepID=A0A4R6RWU9_9MICO|nr:alpha/beta fold hydrolase [Leucobacter luti]TDP91521.1 alpha-beta hydrolase superfamily lysophospholipase [Leucobacter luti]
MPLATHHFPTDTTAPPVILLHGFASSAAEDFIATGWIESLHRAGREVIALDLPGHGESPALTSAAEATTSAVLDAIASAIDTITPAGPIDVVGYSLGARLAWDLPRHSDRVHRLVLGGASPFEPFAAVDTTELAEALNGDTPAHPLAGMMAGMISAPGRDTASLARLIPGLASEPFAPEQQAPRVPTLLVAGSSDPMTQAIEALLAALPHGSLTHVPGDHRGALDSAEFRSCAIDYLAA